MGHGAFKRALRYAVGTRERLDWLDRQRSQVDRYENDFRKRVDTIGWQPQNGVPSMSKRTAKSIATMTTNAGGTVVDSTLQQAVRETFDRSAGQRNGVTHFVRCFRLAVRLRTHHWRQWDDFFLRRHFAKEVGKYDQTPWTAKVEKRPWTTQIWYPIWRVDITPAMRAGVEAGQALFASRKRGKRAEAEKQKRAGVPRSRG